MDTDKINQDLKRRFAAPLPEFYSRRIIFWYDEDREFEDKLEEIQLDNAKLAILNGSNTFAIKKLLCYDDTTSNYLVYQPQSFDRDDDNWLINVQLYSEDFRADLISMWMSEMGLPAKPAARKMVKQYRKFFNAKPRRDAFSGLVRDIRREDEIGYAIMAVLCGIRSMQPQSILQAVLSTGLDMELNTIYQSLVNFGAADAFWIMAGKMTGYCEGDESSLKNLAIHILLTAATRTLHRDYLVGLESFISLPHQSYCYDLISDWLHSGSTDTLFDLARLVEQEARLHQRFSKLDVSDLVDTECFPCIHECVLTSLMTEISQQTGKADVIKAAVEKRRTFAWYDSVAVYYEGLLQVANMLQFYAEHAGGFHTVDPHKLWQEYTSDYYRMDQYYRLFHTAFQKSLKTSHPLLDDLFKQVAGKVEGIYSHWFLGSLAEQWTNICEGDLQEYGWIRSIPRQCDFYNAKVRNADSRVFVIISDALRYEIAESLSDQLRRETQSKVTLSSCEAIFPTITKMGMAALLPHTKLDASLKGTGNLSISADGIPTDATYREKVLKATNPNSTALRFDSIIGLKRAERQELVKGVDVVYIYHDKVDEASHTSDNAVFPACEEAIAELKNLVRIIVNEFGGTRIFITADHGFLYTYSPLKEDDKLDKADFADHVVELGRRYAVTDQQANPAYLLPVRFIEGTTDFSAFAPRENIRIKKLGSGMNYVHGGISLQEMVVPVIEYQFLRSGSKTYQRNKELIDTKPVALTLTSASRKISNTIFSLNFFQTEAMGGNREATSYLLYFTNSSGEKISDINKVVADKTDSDPQERTFRCSFSLKSQKYNYFENYFLVIEEQSGALASVKELFQINIALGTDELSFF